MPDVDFLAAAFGSAQKAPVIAPPAEPDVNFLGKAFSGAPPSDEVAAARERMKIGDLPLISQYYAKHPADESDFWHTPAIDVLGPEDFPGPAGFPRIPPLGKEGSMLRGATEFAGGVEESALGSLSGMTTREGVVTYPLFSVPYVGPALALGMGTKAVASGTGRLVSGIEQGEPRTAGEGVGEAIVGGLMLGAGAHQARGPIGEATTAGRLAAEINLAEFRPRPVSIEGETPGLTPLRRSAAARAAEQGIPVGTEPAKPLPVKPATPSVEEIEPFGTVRQFRVTRQFVNPADEGVYKVGDIITEPQLLKAGVPVPARAAPTAEVAPIIPAKPPQQIPVAREGDIVELHGYVGELGKDAEGRAVVKTVSGFLDIPEGGVPTVRLAVTPEGKIVRNGVLFEPSVGAGKPWHNAYNAEKKWLRVRKVGDGVRLVIEGQSAEYVAERLAALEPTSKKFSTPRKSPGATEEETTSGVGEAEAGVVDSPIDEFLFNAALQREKGGQSASTIRSDQTKPAQAGQVGKSGKTDSGSDVESRPPEQPGGTVQPRPPEASKPVLISLRNNIATDLPEFTLEAINRRLPEPRTGRIFPASVIYDPKQKGFLLVKGPSQRATYKIRIEATPEFPSDLPEGSWRRVKGGIEIDKTAVLAFLNDKARRQAAIVDDRNVTHYAPEDIDVIIKPIGRPATGAAGTKTPPKTLERVVPAPSNRRQLMDVTRRAFDDLRARNPQVIEQLLGRRPEELDEPFWNGIRDELVKSDWVAKTENPLATAEALTADLRRLKEGGDLEWLAAIRHSWESEGGRTTYTSDADSLTDARRLIESSEVKGWLKPETIQVLRDILDSPVSGYLNGRQIRFRITDAIQGDPKMAGAYDPATQTIEIVSRAKPLIAAHEFFHPLWEMVQDGDRLNVKRWRDDAIARALQTATGKDLADLQKLAAGEMRYTRFLDEGIADKFYRLSSTEEFFAHMLTSQFGKDRQGIRGQAKEIWASQDAFISKVRQIIAVIFDAIRQRVPGLRTQADILQRTILDGKYDVLPPSENIPGKRQEVPLREAMGQPREPQAALESPAKVEEYVKPLEETRTPEYFRAMAHAINTGLVPSSVIPRYTSLPAGVRGELEDMFGGRIGTHRETGQTFAQVMADPNITPEQKAEHAHNAFVEWNLYQAEKLKLLSKAEAAAADLAQTITDRIRATPETNDAQVERTNRLGEILDKIHTEQIAVGEKAHSNAVIGEGIEHIAELSDLLLQPAAHARALSGITRLVGRAALTAERPGENVLELIATQTGSPGLSPPLTVRAWVRQLATHLDQLQTPEGNKAINAGREVIEATLWGLRQIGDWRQALIEVQMTADGTLRRFNADYLNDLRSRTPRGFNAILKEYAKAQVESDALSSAARRLDRRIETLTDKKANLEAAAQFLNEHDADPEFVAFGQQMQRATGAIKDIKNTVDGVVVTYEHPLTGADVEVDYRFGGQVELLLKLNALKDAGLEYAARPDADPIKAAGWMHFAEYVDAQILASHADNDRLTDPSWVNPIKWFNFVTKSKYGLISATTASRIPGALNLKMTRAGNAYSLALKTNNALQKKFDEIIRGTNLKAMRSHPGMTTLDRWRDEVASFIHDSRQHTGQTLYNIGDHTPFGHVITKEDMSAIRTQYEFEQHLVRLAQRAGFESALAEDPAMIKEHELRMFRAPLSRGPGTIPRFLPPSSRELPALWKSAKENNQIDQFFSAGDRYKLVVLGHVLENERPYFQLGQGKFAEDYKRIRNEREILFREGRMPASLDELAQFIADRYNQRIAGYDPPLPPATAGEVRRKLIDEVNEFMLKVSDDNARKATAANVDITVHENEFTQPRGGKIAPGTLYRYGTTDPVDAFRKGANALEFYVIKYRDSLRSLNNALLAEKTALSKTLKDAYGGTGWQARRKLNAAIVSGNESVQKHQMAIWEVNRDIARIGRLLNNITDIAKRGEGFFGDDIASRMFMPWWNFAVSNVLLAPMTLITNGVSGEFMWALKTAEIRRGGWLWVPGHLVKDWVRTAIRTAALAELKVPYLKWKGEPVSIRPGAKALRAMKDNAIKRLLDNRDLREAATEIVSGMAQEAADRAQQERLGMVDRFSYREAMGTNAEWTLAENFKAAMAAFRDIHADPSLSGSKEAFGYIGMFPRAGQVLLRHGLMRAVDNWINVKSIAKEQSLGRDLEVRAMRAFDSRLENDPEFARLYREYGDNYKRFSGVLIGPEGKGELLSPAELTGKDPIIGGLTMRKAAVQLRNMFLENNDPVDLIMLKYWWNKTHPNGNRTAPIMTPAQRYALQFKMAEDTNMGTPTSRPTYFMGSKERQIGGVLAQWFLWNTDKLQELFAKVRGQKGSDVRYLPFVFGFLIASGIAGLVARIPGQRANDALFNTISSQPDFLDADNDDDRWKILLSVAANFWGAAGSIFKGFNDAPGKLGIRNPIFGANYVTDLLQTMAKIYQSRDAGPAVDFLARYSPVARALINRAPSREGLVDVRNAANALRAATPETIEAKKRQPSSSSDLRVTPMTPLYNTILNAAATGQWDVADEAFAKAVEQSRAAGNPNPEQAIISAIRSRSPETAVYTRALTEGERVQVYDRLSPENRATVDRVNATFDAIASRYGTGGATARSFGGGRAFGALPSGSSGALADIGGLGGSRSRLSLGSPRGVRYGFRSRSLRRRGLRTRSLLRGGLRRPRRSRLRRLAA